MKHIKLLVLSLALSFFSGTQADARKKDKKNKAVAEKTDTCSVDTFSYAFGIANVYGLKGYLANKMGVDTTYIEEFLKGFDMPANTEANKKAIAYGAGASIRRQIEEQVIPQINKQITGNDTSTLINKELFINGFREAVSGKNQMGMQQASELTRKQMEYYQIKLMERRFGANKKAGEEFLKANAKEKGVKTLKSGVQYKVIEKGKGEIPTENQRVKVHYEGRLIDGTIFDSSYARNEPAVFGCKEVIKGWSEILTMMPVGSKWEIYIPQEKAYGAREAGKIPPFSALIFTVELLEIIQ